MAKDEIVYVVPYRCPRCGTDLETAAATLASWLLCPRCGRASLPPTYRESIDPESAVAVVDPDTIYIGPLFDLDTPAPSPLAPSPSGASTSSSGLSGQRVFLMVLLALAIGAITDAIISRSPSMGFLGFFMIAVALVWIVVGGVRL